MKSQARGLVWDIETSYYIIKSWGIYQTDAIEIIESPQVLTVAWQWVGEKKVYCVGQDDFINYKAGVNDDTEILKLIWKLLDECDYAVAHNGDQFDVKIVNYRFLVRGMKPPSPYIQKDTKKLFKKIAKFPSNSLKYLAKDLKVNQKGSPGGIDTWTGCLAGDPKAWAKMKRYNRQDIPPLMDLYLQVRAWDNQAIPLNVIDGVQDGCPKCASKDIYSRGQKYTKTGFKRQYSCKDCGGWFLARTLHKAYNRYVS